MLSCRGRQTRDAIGVRSGDAVAGAEERRVRIDPRVVAIGGAAVADGLPRTGAGVQKKVNVWGVRLQQEGFFQG